MKSENPERRVGLLGGSFNPPHICHVLASLYLVETDCVDEVWWLPVHRHAFEKDRELRPFVDRVALCEAAVHDHPALTVSLVEASLGERSRTIDTVAALRGAHPQHQFTWIVGSDLLAELPSWHRWDELREQVRFLVLGRGAEVPASELPKGGDFVVRDFQLPDISSSMIRERLAQGADVSAWVPASILALLRGNPGLYR